MSSALAVWLLLAGQASAHEVIPGVADLSVSGNAATVSVRMNLEAIVARIDLEGLADTSEADGDTEYDRLRALPPEAFAAEVEAFWPDFAASLTIEADGAAVAPVFGSVEIPEVGDLEQLRLSVLNFTAPLPEGAEALVLGWDRSYGDLVVRQIGVEAGYTGILGAGELTDPIAIGGGSALGPWASFFVYIPVGFDHIVPLGLDHILFVLGLFLLAARVRPLLWQVTAFTAAHTVTLALGALGIVTIPGNIVEPIIAASIVYVAVENLFTDGLNPWRPAVVFVFGLLHGLGFASVLAEFGLPSDQFIPALLGFNVGVELGQLLVIAIAFLVVLAVIRRTADGSSDPRLAAIYLGLAVVVVPLLAIPLSWAPADLAEALWPLGLALALLSGLAAAAAAAGGPEAYRRIVTMPASVLIALVGSYWVVERVFL